LFDWSLSKAGYIVPVCGFQYPENLFSSSLISSYQYIGLSERSNINHNETAPALIPLFLALDIGYD
jgi:hypothetical protein